MADKRLNLIVDLINKTEAGFKKVYADLDATQQRTENMSRAMKEIGIVGAAAFTGLAFATRKFLDDAGELEQQQIAFETMLGSAEAAADMLGKLSDFASKTPFELQGIRQTAKQLLAMSIDSDKLIPTLKSLGDVSAGLGVDLDRLAYNYGQVKTQTRLTGVELKDFMRAGVPLVGELAKMLGKSEAEIQDMVSAGQIGFPLVEEAFKRMSSEGGQFANLMDKQSASLKGQLSNLNDNITKLSESIGTALIPVAKDITAWLIELTQKITEWGSKNPVLAATILKVTLALTAFLASMGLLGLALPRIVLGLTYTSNAFSALGAVIAFLNKTTVSEFISLIGTKLKAAYTAAVTATRLFTVSLRTLSGAMMATGIGALIIAAGYLIVKFMELSDAVGGFANAFKYAFAQTKKIFYDVMLSIIEGLNKLFSKIPGMSAISAELTDGFKIMSSEANAEMDNIIASIYNTSTAADIAAVDIGGASSDITSALAGIGDSAKKQEEAAKKYFESLVDAVSSVRDEIKDAYKDIQDATADFNKSVGEEQKSYENDVVDTVASAYKDKADLEIKLRQAQARGEWDSIQSLGAAIQEKENIIRTYGQMQLDLDAQIDEARKRLDMNALQRLQFDHEKKLKMMEEEFLQEQVKRLQKLIELQVEHNTIMAHIDAQTKAKIEAELKQEKSFRDRLKAEKDGLKTWMDESIAMYSGYVSSINSIMSRMNGGAGLGGFVNPNANFFARASGGSVNPNQSFLVGENGPEIFTPDSYGRISATGTGAGVTIVLQGNTFVGREGVAQQIASQIMSELKRNRRLS